MARKQSFVYRGPSGRFVLNNKRFERDGTAHELTVDEQNGLSVTHPTHRFEPVDEAVAHDPDIVPVGSVATVMEWVGMSPERAQSALDAEREAGDDARKTLVGQLEVMVTPPAGDVTT